MTDDSTRRQRVRNGSRRKRDLAAVEMIKTTQGDLHRAVRLALEAGSKLDHDSLFVGAMRLAARGESLADPADIRREANAYLHEQKRRCDAHIGRAKRKQGEQR